MDNEETIISKRSHSISPGLFAVTVNWNLGEITARCAQSLFDAGLEARHLIIVDNGSTDGSCELLSQKFQTEVILVSNPTNQGYVYAVNQGIERALNLGAEWIFILNNDTWIDKSALIHLSENMQDNEFAILAPLIFYANAPQKIWHLGSLRILGTLITRSLWRNRVVSERTKLPAIIPVDFVSGCGMLVRSEVFYKVGLFDPVYQMYAEEVDFCWRARKFGYRCACVTSAKMWHIVSASANLVRPHVHYLKVRNQIWFYRRRAPRLHLPLLFLFSATRLAGKIANDIIHHHALPSSAIKGWKEGWFGRIPYGNNPL